jgi:CYTH domain-containing protein
MEIERKYLVNKFLWQELRNPVNSSFIQQAYLSMDPKCSVRIRIIDDKARITIKGETHGLSREEFEYSIPLKDGMEMMRMVATPIILKNRYVIPFQGYKWEIDEFFGDNEGLILAEVELKSEEERPEWPEWIDQEVTGDPRYFNLQLAVNPINHWQ